jgi:hypothetical protein
MIRKDYDGVDREWPLAARDAERPAQLGDVIDQHR